MYHQVVRSVAVAVDSVAVDRNLRTHIVRAHNVGENPVKLAAQAADWPKNKTVKLGYRNRSELATKAA